MSIKVGWLLTDRVIYSQSIGALDIDAIEEHADGVLELLNNDKTTDVYIIIDTLKITKFRVNVVTLNELTKRYLTHPRLKCSIDVTRHIKNQMLGNVVSDMAGIQWSHVETLEAGLQYLNTFDETLPPLEMTLFTAFQPLKEID